MLVQKARKWSAETVFGLMLGNSLFKKWFTCNSGTNTMISCEQAHNNFVCQEGRNVQPEINAEAKDKTIYLILLKYYLLKFGQIKPSGAS